jgi:hypothetical protein
VEVLMSVNIEAEYNLLNDCKYIRNKDQCAHDTNCGFEAIFSSGDCGFSDQSGATWYWAEGRFLWGTSTDTSCYIALQDILTTPFEADYFTNMELDMLVRCSPGITGHDTPETFTSRIAWQMATDSGFTSESIKDFDVYPDGEWHRYEFTMLESPKWVGNCNKVKLFPFVDGYPNVEIIVQRLAFTSDVHRKCKYGPCAYNRHYKHPCKGVGTYASATSTQRRESALVDDSHCRIGIELDGYSAKYIDLDLSHCTDCWSIAQEITLKMNTYPIGGYNFAKCEYDDVNQNFTIYTGTRGTTGGVNIYHGGYKDVTERLGFYSSSDTPTYRTKGGTNAADGFVEAYKKQPATILYRLPNSDVTLIDFDPKQPLIEIGRQDLNTFPVETLLEEGNIEGSLFIDMFGGSTYYGGISTIQYKGAITDKSKLLLMRPVSDRQFEVVYEEHLYNTDIAIGQSSLFQKSVDWSLRPGDVFGLFMCLPALTTEENSKASPELYYKYSWIEKIANNVTVGDKISYDVNNIRIYGYGGFPVYGFSDSKNPGIGIESELRWEYGVDYVAIKGEISEDSFDWDLVQSGLAQVRVSSTLVTGTLQPAKTADLLLEFDRDTTDAWWVDFWLPGYMHDLYKIELNFENTDNIRCFDLELYIPESLRTGLSWSGHYSFSTDAPYLGSQVGWIRLDPPLTTLLDGLDKSNSIYVASTYVTDDPFDYYPGVTEFIRYYRNQESYGTYWNKLAYTYTPFITPGIRLYVWRWTTAQITSASIVCKFSNTDTILRAVDATGFSGPQVFTTESYNVVDVEGQLWSSSNISRSETTDYEYGMTFDFLDDTNEVIGAPVGTTLRIVDIVIKTFPARVKQITLIPQHIATQVRTVEGDEPITEIADLSWGAPSDDSDYTYGPAKAYKFPNDTGHRANLLIGVANPLAIEDSCIFSSSLNTLESVTDPYRGSAAMLISSPNSPLCNNRGLNYHARAYAILDETPAYWYSSTNSGVVWQPVVSGNPFSDLFRWNEPVDQTNTTWTVYSLCRTSSITVSGGYLNISIPSRSVALDLGNWTSPTYFVSTDQTSTMSVESSVIRALPQVKGVDASAGIVVFDSTDISKFVRIERYSGNNASELLGFIHDLDSRFVNGFGDYIRTGDNNCYYSASGSLPRIEINPFSDYPLLFKVDQGKGVVEVRYRLPWTSWTTLSSYDISGWSNELRVGVFTAAESVASAADGNPITASIDYVSYKNTSDKVTEHFSHNEDFIDVTTTNGLWYAENVNSAQVFSTSSDGLFIKPWMRPFEARFFNYKLVSPALMTTWGSITDYGSTVFRVSQFEDNASASGIFSAGMLIRDSSTYTNHVKFAIRSSSYLEVTTSGGTNLIPVDPIDTSSGIWFRMRKGVGSVTPSYSYDGISYTSLSGISLLNWSSSAPVEFALSSDINRLVMFDNIQFGTSTYDATDMAAQFESSICLSNIYGQGFEWTNLRYTDSDELEDFVYTKPTEIKAVAFSKDPSVDVDMGGVKFMPDAYWSKKLGKRLFKTQIFRSNRELFDNSGKSSLVDPPQSTESGTGWTSADSNSYKGLPLHDYPIIALDFDATYQLGRAPLATDLAIGRFSTTDSSMLPDVDWENSAVAQAGFYRKCIYAGANGECTASFDKGKPIMVYDGGDVPAYYFAGTCDGWETDAGPVNLACPLFSPGRARWLLLESTDYVSTGASASGIWFLSPIGVGVYDRPKRVTDNTNWWTTNFGLMQWTANTQWDQDYTMIYGYPGYSIEGSCYFNGTGSPYWKIDPDIYWTAEDSFSMEFKLSHPANVDALYVKVGRDPDCYYLFTVTGTLSRSWTTHTWKYKDAAMVIRGDRTINEPALTPYDEEYYTVPNLPYMPLPFANVGFIEVTASGGAGCNIYFKNLTNVRTRFINEYLFLGTEEAVYIPDLDMTTTGTIEFDYIPSLAAMNLSQGDPREFIYTLASVSSPEAGICLALDLQWGWSVYCFSPEENLVYVNLPSLKEAERIIPSVDNPGPFHIVLSWCPPSIPGMSSTQTVALWVNNILTCAGNFSTLGGYFNSDEVRVILGKGARILGEDDTLPYAAYGAFSNLRIYKHSVSNPAVDIDSTSLIPENLIELSVDGVNWKSFLNGDLPLLFSGLENGESATVYLRNKRPRKEIKKLHRRDSAKLMVKWEVTGIS